MGHETVNKSTGMFAPTQYGFFKRSTFVGSAWSFGFFIPATTANDLRLRRIFYPWFYPLHLFSYLNSWASTEQWGQSFMLKKTSGAFDGSGTHDWQAFINYKSDSRPTAPHRVFDITFNVLLPILEMSLSRSALQTSSSISNKIKHNQFTMIRE